MKFQTGHNSPQKLPARLSHWFPGPPMQGANELFDSGGAQLSGSSASNSCKKVEPLRCMPVIKTGCLMSEAASVSGCALHIWAGRNRVSSSWRKWTRIRNRPSGCRLASRSGLFSRIESAGSISGSLKSSNPVRRIALSQSASLCSRHNHRLRPSARPLGSAPRESKPCGSSIFVCRISDIWFRLSPGILSPEFVLSGTVLGWFITVRFVSREWTPRVRHFAHGKSKN